jgi:shikimate dehydrogenase
MEINARTQLCGLLGNPVEHSLSPAIHNTAFETMGLNFVYLAFKVEDLPGAVKGLRSLGNLRGFSVTIPHKVAIIPLLDEVEPTAKNIGAVNTIVIENGRLIGFNTDASGALRALTEAGTALRGEKILMLGSGGAARAIAFALAAAGIAKLTLLGIDETERTGLMKDLKAKTSLQLADGTITDDSLRRAIEESTVLLHCTPLGMHPNVHESCVPASLLKPHLTVMDIVYNPLDTKLLTDARAAGCRTIRGIEMFLNQAVGQFELWTKQKAPADIMRKVIESRFS